MSHVLWRESFIGSWCARNTRLARISDILVLTESEADLSRGKLVFCDYFEEHVSVWNDFDFLSSPSQHLMAVFVSNKSLELVVESEAFKIEATHHFLAIDRLCVFEFVDSLLFCSHYS